MPSGNTNLTQYRISTFSISYFYDNFVTIIHRNTFTAELRIEMEVCWFCKKERLWFWWLVRIEMDVDLRCLIRAGEHWVEL